MKPPKKEKHDIVIPQAIYLAMDTISGPLTCQMCGVVVAEYEYEIGRNPDKRKEEIPHFCIPKFPYDFNSPLTIKQQYEQYVRNNNPDEGRPAGAIGEVQSPASAPDPATDEIVLYRLRSTRRRR